MELLPGATGLAERVAVGLDQQSRFVLADVGCSGGIDVTFRAFGEKLVAWAFEIDAAECARLQAAETLPGVRYIAGRVGLPAGHPFLIAKGSRDWTEGNPWSRLSVSATQRLRQRRAPSEPRQPADAAADSEPGLIDLAAFFAAEGVQDIDFLKIDVDGADFAILTGLEEQLDALNVLAVAIEVNFYGTHHPTDHTLHNVDRFMRRAGFDLFGLTVRHYSAAALPSRYLYDNLPAEGRTGRPFQGDALYVRDLCAPGQSATAAALPAPKLAKAAAIFSLAGLPDCAAEIVLKFRDRLAPMLDVDPALDLLVATAREDGMPATYRAYCAAFAADSPAFYPPAAGAPAPEPAPRQESESETSSEPAEDPEIGLLRQENAELKRALAALHGSRSWRLTAPLRAATDRLRLIARPGG